MKMNTLGRLTPPCGRNLVHRIVCAIVSLIAAVTTQGEEPTFAKFDAKRVFEQYQHTKEMELAISAKRHPMGPGSYTPSMERHDAIKRHFDNATERLKQAKAGTPERERGELELQIATLELQLDDLRATVENVSGIQTSYSELQRQRAAIISEIWAEAVLLGRERGYSAIIPEGTPSEGVLLNVIINNIKADDITEALLARLNRR